MSDPSAVLNPSAVVTEFQELLDELMDYRAPYPSQMMVKMSDLCSRLKLAGSKLESSFKMELDELQNELVKLCQDSSLDLEVRLQILEIIELRSFGWKANKGMEEFYIEKFNDARKAKEMSLTSPAETVNFATPTVNKSAMMSTSHIEQIKDATSSVAVNEEGDVTRSHLKIGTSLLSLESRDRRLVQLARQQLETFFSRSSGVQVIMGGGARDEVRSGAGDNPPLRRPQRLEVEYVAPEAVTVGSSLKYSREAMLTMANTRHAQDAPINWNERIKELPGVILKQG